MVPSVHFLIRQAAREKLAAARTLSKEARARHQGMAELYISRAQQLQVSPHAEDGQRGVVARRKVSQRRGLSPA